MSALSEICYRIYTATGQSGVLELCEGVPGIEWVMCEPCELVSPIDPDDGSCLVCGTLVVKRGPVAESPDPEDLRTELGEDIAVTYTWVVPVPDGLLGSDGEYVADEVIGGLVEEYVHSTKSPFDHPDKWEVV